MAEHTADFPYIGPDGLPDREAFVDPRPILIKFVCALKKFLYQLQNNRFHPEGVELFNEESMFLLQLAFKELVDDNHFEDLFDKVHYLEIENIRRHGLNGRNLILKINNIRRWYDGFRQRGGWKVLRGLLKAIDTLLDSLIAAVGAGTAIKEFKDAANDCLDVHRGPDDWVIANS